MSILEKLISQSAAAKTSTEAFAHFSAAAMTFGYDRAMYSLVTDHTSRNKKEQHGVFCTYPAHWMARYRERGYLSTDPVFRRVFTASMPITWAEVAGNRQRLPEKARVVMDEARDAGMLEGVLIPLHGPSFEVAGIGLASTIGDVDAGREAVSTLQAMAVQFHTTHALLDSDYRKCVFDLPELTKRDREVLLWSAEGKSVPVIASIMATSEDNVKYHLKKIYKKLDVADRVQAVLKAVSLGLINPKAVKPLLTT